MNNYLHSLPFHKDAKNLSSCDCKKQGFDPPSFKLYSEADRFPTFVLRLPPVGTSPDLTYAKECILVVRCDGKKIASVTTTEAGIEIHKDDGSYYLTYDGRSIPGIKMDCGECYRLKIADNYSEVFWITATPNEKIRLEFTNQYQLGDVPYQIPFKQVMLMDGDICALPGDLFENRKGESNGKETISYQRMTMRKGLTIVNAPDFVQQLIVAAILHDSFSVFYRNVELKSLSKRVQVQPSQNNCCDYDIEVIIPTRDIEIIGGNCQSDTDGTLTEVEIPDGLPDSCEVDDDYEETSETICLKFGEVPPPIDPIIIPPITPPVGSTCPPDGKLISESTQTLGCESGWISNGYKYKKKTSRVVANGTCGTRNEFVYSDPCEAVIIAHSITNPQCSVSGGTTPPITPPITPPVTPPITPPVTPPITPPTTTPPSGSSRSMVMNTTGYGFDPSDSDGINANFKEIITAFNTMSSGGATFSGINAVRINVKWFDYEPTEGQFNDSKLIAARNWLKAKGLKICVCLVPWRRVGDNVLPQSEWARLQDGNIWLSEGDLAPITTYNTYIPSMQSALGRTKFKAAAKHMAQTLKATFPEYADYMSCATAVTEEFQLVRQESPIMMTGYGDVDRDTWAAFSGNKPVFNPDRNNMPASVFAQVNSDLGKEWYEFQTRGLVAFHAAFRDGVKEGGMKVCGMYAGMGAPSAAYDYSNHLDRIFYGCDIIYSSAGDRHGQDDKIRATDLNIGTFNGVAPAIEFDPDDISRTQEVNPPYGTDLDGELFLRYARSFYNRGGLYVHFAMSFHPAKVYQIADACRLIQVQFISSAIGIEAVTQGTPINFQVTDFAAYQAYNWMWGQNGGSLTKQVKIDLKPMT